MDFVEKNADCPSSVDVVINKWVEVKGSQDNYLAVIKDECATDPERLKATIDLVTLTCQFPDHTYHFDPRKLRELISTFTELSFDVKEKCKKENAVIATIYKNVADEKKSELEEAGEKRESIAQALCIIHLAISSELGNPEASRELALIYAQKDKYHIPFGDDNSGDVIALNYAQVAQQQGCYDVWFALAQAYESQAGKTNWAETCRDEWTKLSTAKVETSCYDIVAALYPQETIDWITAACYDIVASHLEHLGTLNTINPTSICAIQ